MAQAFEHVLQDVRYAVRTLHKSLGFTGVVLAALALGVGATTAIFTVVNSVLLEPLPFSNPGHLVALREIRPDGQINPSVQTQNFLDWRARNHSFERMAALMQLPVNVVATDGNAEQVNGLRVSADFFPLLGARPLLGRWLTPEDDRPGAPPRVILSFGFWQRRFGGDPRIIGSRLTVFGSPGEVIGVMPSEFVLPNIRAELFVAAQINPAFAPRDGRNFQVYGRMRNGVRISAAQAEMRSLAVQTAAERPAFNTRWTATAMPLLDDAVGDVRTSLLVLLGAVFFVLVLCCVNVANLYLMRTYDRARELMVRHALGAGRGRILHQLLAESLLLTLTGGLLGIGFAYGGVRVLLGVLPASFPLPRLAEVQVDGRVLAVCLGVSLIAGIAFGLAPALAADFRNPANALRHSGRSIAGRRSVLGSALVVAEVALALVLVCGAGLMARSFVELHRVNPGFRPERLLTLRMLLVPAKYGPDLNARATVVEEMLAKIRALPQVSAAASIHWLPMNGIGSGSGVYRADRPKPQPGSMPAAGFSIISDGYFHAMGIPLIAGREFSSRDRSGSTLVAVINRAAARMLYPNESPLGKQLMVEWNGPPQAEIVGIAADSRFEGIEAQPEPFIFLPNSQRPSLFCGLVVRNTGDPLRMIAAVREAIRNVDPGQGVMETSTMEQRITDSVARPRLQTILLGAFGVLALVLACIGIYGVLAYAVSQRLREIGVRLALGATPGAILGEILGNGLGLAAVGLFIGLGAALGLTRYLETLLYSVRPTDPAVFALAITTLLLVATAACYLPARRAAQVDPMVVLREE
jgi:putative ABC transport system permease protein